MPHYNENDRKILQSERDRLRGNGLSGREVMRLTTGENGEKRLAFIKEFGHGPDYEDLPPEEMERLSKGLPVIEKKKIGRPKKKTPPIIIEEIDLKPETIKYLCDQYESELHPETRKALYKPHSVAFTGLIKYVSQKSNIKAVSGTTVLALAKVWNSYISLVYSHNQLPNIIEFSIYSEISRDEFFSWKNQEKRREFCYELTLTRADVCKKILDECENARYKLAESGNVGGIFLSKAVDGLVETAPAHVQNPVQVRDNVELAMKLGLKVSENKPDQLAITEKKS